MRRLLQLGVVAALTVAPPGAARAEPAKGLLSVAQANVVASAQHDQVKHCYFRHALVEPGATGRVRVDVFVKSDGGVARARVDAPGIKRRAFERCVVARALTWRFPASAGWTEVRMPFRFHVPARFRHRSRASS
ncbi:MAG TPA: AgmX/PglI C-terminal domain-containing protein [Kofleriaceae bacterium]|nr:AgmX/PglI C-terminal domain-containing protein [Kofleriaceae bacterium]